MQLPEQVTSLAISKRLKELGVKQESYFEWKRYGNIGWNVGKTQTMAHETDFVAALTVSELSEMLAERKHCFLPTLNTNWDHGWYYRFFRGPVIHEATLVDCVAKMLIYLICEDNNTKE